MVTMRQAGFWAFCLLGIATASCGGGASALEGRATPRPGEGPDPRAMGSYEFTSIGAPPVITHGGAPPLPSLDNERPASRRAGETSALVGSTLYVLTAQRGLQVVQVAATPPAVVGQVPIGGVPFALFVSGTSALAVMNWNQRLEPCDSCPGKAEAVTGALIAAADLADPGQPRLAGTLPLVGQVLAAHRAGPRLFLLVARDDATSLLAIDVSNPGALRLLGRFDVPAPTWVDEVRFATASAYLALYGRQFWAGDQCQPLGMGPEPPNLDGCTRLVAVDLETMRAGRSVDLRGRLLPGRSDHFQGVLRALLVSSGTSRDNDRIVTLSAGSPSELAPLGALTLPTRNAHGGGWDPGVRFDGPRAYLVSNDQNIPLLILDLSQPARPALGGILPMVGPVSSIFGSTGGRLVTGGVERLTPICARSEVALFDVEDPARPVLVARQNAFLGGPGIGSSLGEGDHLLLVPFMPGSIGPGQILPNGINLIDVDLSRGTLTPRGHAWVVGQAERILRVGDRAVSLSWSRAEIIDLRDLDRPVVSSNLELARSVSDLALAGDSVVQVGQHPSPASFLIALSPAVSPDAPATSSLAVAGREGYLFTQGSFVYQFLEARLTSGGAEPQLHVLQVENGRLQPRGALSLAGPAAAGIGNEPARDGFAQQVRQVGGTTFLVPLQRTRDCRPGITPTLAPPPPTCASVTGGNPPPLPPTPPVPPSALTEPARPAPLPPPAEGCPGSDADFLVVDASNPAEPRIASRFRLPHDAPLLGSIARDRTVFVTQREKTRLPDRTELLRHFVTEVQLDDAARPVVGPAVNVPGGLVAERASDRTWITVEPIFSPQGPPAGVTVNVLYQDARSSRAFLQRRLALMGSVSEPVRGGEILFFTVDGQLVAVDPFAPEGPRIRSRTPVLGANASGGYRPLGTPVPADHPGDPPAPRLVANVHGVVRDHVFVLLGYRFMLIYDARDPDQPVRLDRFTVASDRSPIRFGPGNRALLARDQSSVEVLDLPLP